MARFSNRLKVTRPGKAWEETEAIFGERLRNVADYSNATYDVEPLCKGMPEMALGTTYKTTIRQLLDNY